MRASGKYVYPENMKTPAALAFLLLPLTLPAHALASSNACDSAMRLTHADDAFYGDLYYISEDGRPHIHILARTTFMGSIKQSDRHIELRRDVREPRREENGEVFNYDVRDSTVLTLDDDGRVIRIEALHDATRLFFGYQEILRTSSVTLSLTDGSCQAEKVRIERKTFENGFIPEVDVDFDREACLSKGKQCFEGLPAPEPPPVAAPSAEACPGEQESGASAR